MSTPVRKIFTDKTHRNPVAWWDSDCEKAIRLRKASLKKWKFTKSREDYIELKKNALMQVK